MIWNKEYECMDRKNLENLQLKKLKEVTHRVFERLPFYKRKFEEKHVHPGQIKSLEDLRKLPFTSKPNLREGYPFGLFTVPLEKIVEVHISSGTTGKPIVNGYTRKDVQIWAEVMARALSCAGTTSKDVVHNAYGYGLFTGGLRIHYGAQLIGAKTIPISGGQTRRQITIMQDFKSTILTCTPSYALHLAEVAEEMGINPRDLSLRVGVLGAETWSESMRQEIEARLGIEALDIYGLTEIIGPGVAQECQIKKGMHLFEDHFLPEIIDPKTGSVLKEGEEGELVLTTLTREGTSLVRYRTGDITHINYRPCECERTLARIGKIKGRVDDMLIIRGVNLFPSQIENILVRIDEAEPHYQLILERRKGLDELTVELETSPHTFFDEVRKLEEIETKIEREIEDVLGLRIGVRLVEPRTIQRSMGKAKRIIDKRKVK